MKSNTKISAVNELEFVPESSESQAEANGWPIPVLRENIHYTREKGLIVFSKAYHLARGVCCGSGCRHCPY